MFTITIKFLDLTEKMEQELEKEFANLEKITKKPREYHFKEALINYIQDIEEIEETEKHIKKNKMPPNYHIIQALIMYIQDIKDAREVEKRLKTETKWYTSEEIKEHLKQYYDEKEKKGQSKKNSET